MEDVGEMGDSLAGTPFRWAAFISTPHTVNLGSPFSDLLVGEVRNAPLNQLKSKKVKEPWPGATKFSLGRIFGYFSGRYGGHGGSEELLE